MADYLAHTFTISSISTVGNSLTAGTVWNQFDEHGLLVGLKRLPAEKNWTYRRRIFDSFVNRANSAYRGMVNAITRELGLSFFYPITITPKISPYSGNQYAADPYILFDGTSLHLYKDYANSKLQYSIDLLEQGGNYELFGRLVDFINQAGYFDAALLDESYRYIRCGTLLPQSSRYTMTDEPLSSSTRIKLGKNKVVANTLSFTDENVFAELVSSFSDIDSLGDYYVDLDKGIIGTYTAPSPAANVSYQYSIWPWKPIASPVILHSLSDENFQRRLYKQILLDDNTYTDGLPTFLATEVINTLLKVYPLYWGV